MASKTLKASVVIGGSLSSSFRGALTQTKDGLKRIGQEIANVERRQRQLASGIDTFGRMGKNVDGMRARYAALTVQADKLRAAQSRLANISSRIEANASRRQEIGGKLTGAVGVALAIAAPLGLAAKKAADFQRESQLIGNTAGMTAREIATMNRAILDTSAASNQMADDVQGAMGFLVAAGLDAKTAQASILAIGRTSTAAGADIQDLSRASFTLIDALKIKPDGLQGALDILAVAGKEGNVELRDMAKTLPQLGASFVGLKMTGTEAAATLGAALEIARKGAGDADEAANNMKNFMSKVLSPLVLKNAKKKLGIDLYAIIKDAQKHGGNPFEAAMKSIMKTTKGDQKKIGEVFQDMQVQNFIRPMIQNWDEYNRIKNKALNGSKGNTDRDFDKLMATSAEQMKAAKAATDRFAKTLGGVLLPQIGASAGGLAGWLDKASAFVAEHPRLVGAIAKVALGMAALRVATLGAGYAVTTIKAPFLNTLGFIAKWRADGLIASMGRLAPMASAAVPAFEGVGAALAGVAAVGLGPILLIGAALVGAALLVRKYWEPIKAFFSGMFSGIMEGAGPAFAEIGAALAPLKPAWDAFAGAVAGVWNWITKILEPVHLTADGLKKATDTGHTFGQVVGGALGFIAKMITAPLRGFMAMAGFAGRIGGAVRGWFGGSDAPVAPGAPAARAGLPVAPAGKRAPIAATAGAARNGRAPVNVSNNTTIHVTQQPGENSEAFAKRVADDLHRRNQAAQRGSLADGVD